MIQHFADMVVPEATVKRLKECVGGMPEVTARQWVARIFGHRSWSDLLDDTKLKMHPVSPATKSLVGKELHARLDFYASVLREVGGFTTSEAVGLAVMLSEPLTNEHEEEGEDFDDMDPGQALDALLDMFSPKMRRQPTKGAESLFAALNDRDFDTVLAMLAEKPELADAIDSDGMPLIVNAALHEAYEVVEFAILEGRADPNEQDAEGFTALHEAAKQGDWSTVELLLESGANPNIRTNMGWTPLTAATTVTSANSTFEDYQKVFDLLLDNGALVSMQTPFGYTFIDLAEQLPTVSPEILAKARAVAKAQEELREDDES